MSLSFKDLKPELLRRYRDIAALLIKYGHSDLARESGLEELLNEGGGEQRNGTSVSVATAEELVKDIEQLGPTFIKLGQILSSRADMLPMEYLEAMSRLQDHVEPVDFELVRQTVEEELGTKISRAFTSFEETPVAAASLGQVHRATLINGRPVAVKVQRPDIRRRVVDDFEALQNIASLIDRYTRVGRRYEFSGMLDGVRQNLLRELDYREEARNLETLHEALADYQRIIVPRPVKAYSTGRVLTMDYVFGRKITSISPLTKCEIDGEGLLKELFDAYLDQITVHGFFHADPHPGNIFLTSDNRIALLDLGMVAKVSETQQRRLLKFLIAISQGEVDEAALMALEMSEPREDADEEAFRIGVTKLITETQGERANQINYGKTVMSLQKAAVEHGYRLPQEVRMLAKVLLNLERVARVLCDSFDPNQAIRDHAAGIMQRRFMRSLSPTQLMRNAQEVKELIEHLPSQVSHLMDLISTNNLKLRIDAIDEDRLIVGIQKVANRITVGLVLAAMIVGACMLMDVDTPFRLFGYPGLAILLFIFAASMGGFLVINILWSDIKKPPGKKK